MLSRSEKAFYFQLFREGTDMQTFRPPEQRQKLTVLPCVHLSLSSWKHRTNSAWKKMKTATEHKLLHQQKKWAARLQVLARKTCEAEPPLRPLRIKTSLWRCRSLTGALYSLVFAKKSRTCPFHATFYTNNTGLTQFTTDLKQTNHV